MVAVNRYSVTSLWPTISDVLGLIGKFPSSLSRRGRRKERRRPLNLELWRNCVISPACRLRLRWLLVTFSPFPATSLKRVATMNKQNREKKKKGLLSFSVKWVKPVAKTIKLQGLSGISYIYLYIYIYDFMYFIYIYIIHKIIYIYI